MELWTVQVSCLLLSVFTGFSSGLEITSSSPGSLEKASGQSVTLDCQFTLAPGDIGPLDIEWSLPSSDTQKDDIVILLFSGDRTYDDYDTPLKGRVHFNAPDPKNGDASINLTGLKSSDSGTYQCKVKKAPSSRSKKIVLNVMVRPSKPRCFAEGPTQVGKDIMLRCVSGEGSKPLKYTWEKISGNKVLPASSVDDFGGSLNVRNASASASGTYRCLATNRVGSEECILHLKVTPPPNTAGIVAGSIIGVLLFLLIIALILFCFCRARHKKKYEKEICNEIREDVPPPKSRVSSARSYTVASQHSSLSSMSPSNLHEYALKPQYDKIPSSEEYDRPPSHVPLPPSSSGSRMAAPSISRMGGIPVMIPAQSRDGSIV
ncbi:coxsackievirus and adenovirus receptor homolog [Pholidichthys leucotaenia]